jgi:hypothetical protein
MSGITFGVGSGLADSVGLAGGRIDETAGEVVGSARLAACWWLRPGACGQASQ